MEKITLKYECPETGENCDIEEKIVMTFDSEGMDIYDFVDKLRKFALAIGYMPESVKRGFSDDDY